MISISNLSSFTNVQVAQPRVVGQDATAKSASTSSTPTYRPAEAGANLFSASISESDRTTTGLQDLLGGELEKLFGALGLTVLEKIGGQRLRRRIVPPGRLHIGNVFLNGRRFFHGLNSA